MAGAPPWADQRFYTTPSDHAASAPPAAAQGPDAGRYDTPPPGGAPAPAPVTGDWGAADPAPFLRSVPTEPGVWGGVDRTGIGFIQSMIGPGEQLGRWMGFSRDVPQGVKDRLKLLKQTAESTPEGQIGETAGALYNPITRAIKPVEALSRVGPLGVRVASRLAQSALAGALGGAIAQPGNTRRQAEAGGVIGGILGIPGATATGLGFDNFQQLAGRYIDRIPVVRDLVSGLKSGGEASFNKVWLGHALQPIGGRVPATAGFAGMRDVETQIGNAIDRSTAGMMIDARPGTTAAAALDRTMAVAHANLSADAWDRYQDTIRNVVIKPMSVSGRRLGAAAFRDATSNLAAEIRSIRPTSAENRALRFELEQFRMRMFDNSIGGNRVAYGRARDAWQRFAVGRDSIPLGSKDGIFSPDDLATEINKRNPLSYGPGRARDQRIANAAQQALFSPTRAARGAIAGRGLTQPDAWSGRAGAAIAPPYVRATQPETYQSATPGL